MVTTTNQSTTYTIDVKVTSADDLNKLSANMAKLASAHQKLLGEVRKAAAENTAYIKSLGLTAKEVDELTKAEVRANKVMQQTAAIQAKSAQSAATSGAQYKNISSALGPLSLQAQDFAVQVSMGTSAMTAFAQQAPQFLGGFGAIGAGIGFAVAAIPLIVTAVQSFTGAAEDLNKAAEDVAKSMDAVKEAADILTTPLKELGFLSDEAAQRFRDLTEAQLSLRSANAAKEIDDLSKSIADSSARSTRALNDLTQAELNRQAVTNISGIAGVEAAKNTLLVQQEIDRLLEKRAEAMNLSVAQAKELGETWSAVQKAEAGSVQQQQELIKLAQQRAKYGADFGTKLNEQLDQLLEGAKNYEEIQNALAKAGIGPEELARMEAYAKALQDAQDAASGAAMELAGLEAQADALERGASAEEARQAAQEAITTAKWEEARATAANATELSKLNNEWLTYMATQKQIADAQARIRAEEEARREAERKAMQADREAQQAREQAAKTAANEQKARMDDLRGILQAQAPEWLKINAEVDRYNELMAEAKAIGLPMNEIDQFLNEQVLKDFQDRWDKIRTTLSDTGEALVGGFTTFFDEVVTGSKSAADAFEDMLVSITQDIVKFLASKAVEDILLFLADLGGFKFLYAKPGMPSTPTGLQVANVNAVPMARVGAVPTVSHSAIPSTGMTRALVLPSPLAASTTSTGSGGWGSPNVVVNNYTSAEVTTSEGTSPDGSRTLEIEIRERVKGLFATGAMDATMRQNYGVRRLGGR